MTIDWYFFFRPVPLGTGRRITIRREIACGRHALATCSSSYWELHFAVLVPELHPRFSVHLRISIIIHHTPWLHTLPRGLLQKEIYPNTNWYGDHHPVICTGLFYREFSTHHLLLLRVLDEILAVFTTQRDWTFVCDGKRPPILTRNNTAANDGFFPSFDG